MRILLLNEVFQPDTVATSQYATDVACFLKEAGHDVTVVCGRRDYREPGKRYPKREEWNGIRILRVPTPGIGRRTLVGRALDAIVYDLASFLTLMRLPRQDATIAFTSPPLVGVQGALFKRLRGGRFVHWIMNVNHEMAIEMGCVRRGSLVARLLTALYRFAVRSADSVVVMDEWMKKRVLAATEIPASRVAVVPLWPVDDPDLKKEPADAAPSPFRAALGLEKKFVVAHSGNLSYVHPLETVLDAAVRLKDSPDVRFVFVGHGHREKDIDAWIARHGLTNVVKVPHQPRESLGASLASADLHLVVMGNEASGLAHSSKIYSILASGRPYLFVGPRDSHVVGDILQRCPFGFHVEHGDVAGLVEVIERVKRLSPEELAMYRRRNRAFVAAHFSRNLCLDVFARSLRSTGDLETPRVQTRRA